MMKNGWRRRLALVVLPLLAAWLLKLWFFTCRKRIRNREYLQEALATKRPVLFTSWHYSILNIVLLAGKIPMTLMVSSSNDGDLLALMLQRLGFSVVRGSSHRKGMIAAKELIREMRAGKNSGVVADGSQGPAMIAQAGPLLLAAKSGRIVLPINCSASRYFTFKSWDRLILPRPFSSIDFVYGKPIYLPEGVRASSLDEYRDTLEIALNEVYREAWDLHGKEKHWSE